MVNGTKSYNADGVVSSTWILRKWYSLRHTFPLAPRKPLSTASVCTSSLSLVISLSCTVASTILFASFESFKSPIQPPNSHPPALAIRSVISVSERYCLSFGQAWYFCLNVVDPGSRSLCNWSPVDPLCFSSARYRTFCFNNFTMFCYFLSRIVYHQSINPCWILKCKSSTLDFTSVKWVLCEWGLNPRNAYAVFSHPRLR